MSDARKPGLETIALHGGQTPDPVTGSRAVPIHQTTSFQFKNTEHAANLFGLKEFGNIYTRLMNPTNDVAEQRIAQLEGGVGGLVTASGQAAETLAILNLAQAGDHIVVSTGIYGGTWNLFRHTLPRLGIEATFVDPDDFAGWRAAIKPNTKALYGETVGNPRLSVHGRPAGVAEQHAVDRQRRSRLHGRWNVDRLERQRFAVRRLPVRPTSKHGGRGGRLRVVELHQFANR